MMGRQSRQSQIVKPDIHKVYVAPRKKAIIAYANQSSNINLLHICGDPIGLPSSLELFADYEAAA